MQFNFEQQKNIKASIYTTLICFCIVLLFFMLHWNQLPTIITPPQPSYLEVNLGNSETGIGTTPPTRKESPAPDIDHNQTSKPSLKENGVKLNSHTNDLQDEAISTQKITKKTNTIPAQKLPKPKAIFGKYAGGNGKGGNNQDSYNNAKDQGITGGKGDQGVAGGKPNGEVYSGMGGPLVTKGDRHITKVYSFTGEVEAATIYAEIEVTPSGNGKFIQIVKGSSSNDLKYKKAITTYLTKIIFNTSDHSSVIVVKFKFEVQ